MLKDLNLDQKTPRNVYRDRLPGLELRLSTLQQRARALGIPVIVVFEGWDAAGKGSCTSRLLQPLDPRGYKVWGIEAPTEDERARPFLWRFWTRLPARGQIALFNRSWYRRVLTARVEKEVPPQQWRAAYDDIVHFERHLTDAGTLLIKLWFQISRKTQKKRFKRIRQDPAEAWRMSRQDRRQQRLYDEYLQAAEEMLERTHRPNAGWVPIEAHDRRFKTLKVFQTVIDALEQAVADREREQVMGGRLEGAGPGSGSLDGAGPGSGSLDGAGPGSGSLEGGSLERGSLEQDFELLFTDAATVPYDLAPGRGSEHLESAPEATDSAPTATDTTDTDTSQAIDARAPLARVDLGRRLEPEAYQHTLERLQERLRELEHQIYQHRIPVIIAYEGWDAAGKGGNIKRLTERLDPRGYEVVPIAAPTHEEKEYHYLWRFWRRLPKAGHLTIFDRTWYGRVLVERVEGFAAPAEWMRAYDEINAFERNLAAFGTVIVKFWLHIDPDEQLRRFVERTEVPYKRWKITEEDWRNREKWGAYEAAVNDMIRRTDTPWAPWTIVEAVDKRFARVKTLQTTIDMIEAAIARTDGKAR